MDVGIGLPNTVPGVDRRALLEWAKRAEDRGFSSVGSLDRLVYPNFEALVSLSAAAAVTERVRLVTMVLLAPLRSTAVLAKQAATLDSLSGGRLTLGVALGAREDDYETVGVDWSRRGQLFDAQLEEMRRIWSSDEIGPPPANPDGPTLLVGGSVDAAFRRAAQHGAGWTMGGGTPDQFKEAVEKLEKAWSEAGRDGTPRKSALAYFGLGPEGEAHAEKDLKHYYEWLGDDIANAIASSAATDEGTVKGYLQAFEEAGCDELVFFPTSTDVEQVDLLADAAL